MPVPITSKFTLVAFRLLKALVVATPLVVAETSEAMLVRGAVEEVSELKE